MEDVIAETVAADSNSGGRYVIPDTAPGTDKNKASKSSAKHATNMQNYHC